MSSAAGSALWSFMAIWALEELDAKRELPYAFLVGAILAGVFGVRGGYLSDHRPAPGDPPRRGIVIAYPIVLLLLSGSKWAGLVALALAGVFGALGGSVRCGTASATMRPGRCSRASAWWQPCWEASRSSACGGASRASPLLYWSREAGGARVPSP
ncbi:MAG TPA: hypothetical protein VHH57_05340 [Gaiella sp.]|nr:hypothetical protein [Gaiella sp.]